MTIAHLAKNFFFMMAHWSLARMKNTRSGVGLDFLLQVKSDGRLSKQAAKEPRSTEMAISMEKVQIKED
jgi:hypothetical protein